MVRSQKYNFKNFPEKLFINVNPITKVLYPEAAKAFELAAHDWAISMDAEVIKTESIICQRGYINLMVLEYQAVSLLAYWDPGAEMIVTHPKIAENSTVVSSVMRHEMGHAIGMPHIIQSDEIPNSRVFYMEGEHEPQKLIMYPYLSGENLNANITDLELFLLNLELSGIYN